MREVIDRRIFILRNQISTAYSNFLVSRAFQSDLAEYQNKIVKAVVAIAVVMLFGAGLGSTLLIGESTANIPAVPIVELSAPVAKPAVTKKKAMAVPRVPAKTPRDGRDEKPVQQAALTLEPRDEPNAVPEIQPLPDVATVPDMPALPPLPEMPPTYSVVVVKATKKLYILRERSDYFEVVRTFDVSIGKELGAKQVEGDLKTPEGYYRIVAIKEDAELAEIYGPRAFVLNYPNRFDAAAGRTGDGIWLHGSGLGSKTPDTRGCVELDDANILALDEWVSIGTSVAIYSSSFQLPVVDGKLDKRYVSSEFFYGDFPSDERVASVIPQ